jgi:hypothetical protein
VGFSSGVMLLRNPLSGRSVPQAVNRGRQVGTRSAFTHDGVAKNRAPRRKVGTTWQRADFRKPRDDAVPNAARVAQYGSSIRATLAMPRRAVLQRSMASPNPED